MRKTTKRPAASRTKKEVAPVEHSIDESQYINVREVPPELQKKQTILWILVGVFTFILVISWLLVLRVNIKQETAQLNFNQLGQQISDSLARFDTEIKSKSEPQAINVDDLNSIKTNLEQQIKSNPDSSLWPTHEFIKTSLSLQYPANWQKLSETKELLISDTTTTELTSQYGQLTITIKDNSKKLTLTSWLEKYSDLSDYQQTKSIFVFTSTTPETSSYLKINPAATVSSTLNRLYFINATSSKKIIEINTESRGDDTYYQPLLEEIIRTIRIIK